MAKLILKLLCFSTIVGVSLSVAIFFLFPIIKNRETGNFRLNSQNRVLLLGHSHSACALNDEIINDLDNFSQAGESYFYTYPKLRLLLEYNKQYRHVFIEFSNNQIFKTMDNWIWSDKYLNYLYSVYFPFITPEDQKFLFYKNPISFISSVLKSSGLRLKALLNRRAYWSKATGRFQAEKVSVADSLLRANAIGTPLPQAQLSTYLNESISYHNLIMLRRLIDLSRRNNKKVFLVRSPQHPQSPERNNEYMYQFIRHNFFSDVYFLDFNDYPLKTSELYDLSHLNYYGATTFSKWAKQFFESDFWQSITNSDSSHASNSSPLFKY